MTMTKKLSRFEIRAKLNLFTASSKKAVDQRLAKLEFNELRTLMNSYDCSLEELTDKIWSVECLGKTKTGKEIR